MRNARNAITILRKFIDSVLSHKLQWKVLEQRSDNKNHETVQDGSIVSLG